MVIVFIVSIVAIVAIVIIETIGYSNYRYLIMTLLLDELLTVGNDDLS